MENFTCNIPTVIHFGKNVCSELGKTAKQYGNKALLVYGGGSIKKNGIFSTVVHELKHNQMGISEFSGIKPNPNCDDVDKAAKKGIQNNVEVVVAVGGGSVIDSAKIIALCIASKQKAWDIMTRKVNPESSIPLIAVLTLAATGTEMNMFAVLQNPATMQKIGYGNRMSYPKHSFLDPQYTYTVAANYTSYGIVDIVAHSLEAFFANGESPLADSFVVSIIKECMTCSQLLLNDLKSYDYRARILWASTCALNGFTSFGRASTGDWGVHDIGHTLSFLYDVPHGASLSIVYPAWLKLHKVKAAQRISALGKLLFGTESVDETIELITEFFRSIQAPTTLNEIGITEDKQQEIFSLMKKNKVGGMVYSFKDEDYSELIRLMFSNITPL